MKHKHRGNGKIKREHDMIAGLDEYLRQIESIREINSIVPSIITMRKSKTGGFSFKVQYPTDTGLRCIAKNQGSVQEVFINSGEPMVVWQKIDGDI